jgi:TM2 domain-containing membrane protein YozV
MNRAKEVIALTIVLIAGLWVYSCASPSDAQTYVSRNGSLDLALDGSSRFLLAQQMEDSIRVHTSDSLKLKDPNMALLYAVVPGVVVHGSGHFYAGKTGTGAVLLGAGVVGGAVFFIGGVGKGFSQMEGGEAWKYGDVLMVFGAVLFVGSWIYDLVGAPHAVQRQNRELMGTRDVQLRFCLDGASHSVRVQIAKRF